MAAIVDCPLCSRKLRILDAYEGDPVKCPSCGGTFVAPTETEVASIPAAAAGPVVTEKIAPLEIGSRQAVPPVPKLKPRLIGEEKVAPSRPLPPTQGPTKLPLRLCPSCGRHLEGDAMRCTHCGEPLGDDDRPWPYRDCEPHRGGLILAVGIISIVLITTCALSIIGLPMGIAAWTMAQGDLRKMRAGRMDPDGMRTTESGRTCAIIGTVLNTLGLLYLAMMFAVQIAGGRF